MAVKNRVVGCTGLTSGLHLDSWLRHRQLHLPLHLCHQCKCLAQWKRQVMSSNFHENGFDITDPPEGVPGVPRALKDSDSSQWSYKPCKLWVCKKCVAFFFFKHAWFFQMWDLFLKRLSDLYSGNEKQDLVLIKCWLLLSDTLPPFLAPLLRMLLFQLWNSSFPHQLWGLSHHLEESSLSTLSKYYPSPTHGPVTHTHRFAMN